MTLAAKERWKAGSGKYVASLKRHSVYVLVPTPSDPAGHNVVGF